MIGLTISLLFIIAAVWVLSVYYVTKHKKNKELVNTTRKLNIALMALADIEFNSEHAEVYAKDALTIINKELQK